MKAFLPNHLDRRRRRRRHRRHFLSHIDRGFYAILCVVVSASGAVGADDGDDSWFAPEEFFDV